MAASEQVPARRSVGSIRLTRRVQNTPYTLYLDYGGVSQSAASPLTESTRSRDLGNFRPLWFYFCLSFRIPLPATHGHGKSLTGLHISGDVK